MGEYCKSQRLREVAWLWCSCGPNGAVQKLTIAFLEQLTLTMPSGPCAQAISTHVQMASVALRKRLRVESALLLDRRSDCSDAPQVARVNKLVDLAGGTMDSIVRLT
jgi:hypothetical protein